MCLHFYSLRLSLASEVYFCTSTEAYRYLLMLVDEIDVVDELKIDINTSKCNYGKQETVNELKICLPLRITANDYHT